MAREKFLPKLLLLIGLCLICVSIFTAAGYAIAYVLYDVSLSVLTSGDSNSINALKVVQAFSATGLFILPPLLFAWLTCSNLRACLQLDKFPTLPYTLLFLFIILASTPIINWLYMMNQQLDLPPFLQNVEDWMKASEAQAAELTDAFLKVNSLAGLIFNILVIALIPALGEELLFRGVLQRMLSGFFNGHLAVFITAFLFSALHMQFFGFMPRLALGMVLGYAFLWSRSLWLPIIIHFINNALAVIFAWTAQESLLPFNQDKIGTEESDTVILIASILMTVGGLIYADRLRRQNELSA